MPNWKASKMQLFSFPPPFWSFFQSIEKGLHWTRTKISLGDVFRDIIQVSLILFTQCCWLHSVDNATRRQILQARIKWLSCQHKSCHYSTGNCQYVQLTFYIPKNQQPLCSYLTIICNLSVFNAKLTLPMGESTLIVLISLKHYLYIVVDVKCRTCCAFTTADGGICGKCRPADSLLRQREAGRRADARRAAGVAWLWLWRRQLWHHQAARALLAVSRDRHRQDEAQRVSDEDRPQFTQEMGSCSQDHTYPSGTRKF